MKHFQRLGHDHTGVFPTEEQRLKAFARGVSVAEDQSSEFAFRKCFYFNERDRY